MNDFCLCDEVGRPETSNFASVQAPEILDSPARGKVLLTFQKHAGHRLAVVSDGGRPDIALERFPTAPDASPETHCTLQCRDDSLDHGPEVTQLLSKPGAREQLLRLFADLLIEVDLLDAGLLRIFCIAQTRKAPIRCRGRRGFTINIDLTVDDLGKEAGVRGIARARLSSSSVSGESLLTFA
jgi:hypothetical protein